MESVLSAWRGWQHLGVEFSLSADRSMYLVKGSDPSAVAEGIRKIKFVASVFR
jgi:hypothetical protein